MSGELRRLLAAALSPLPDESGGIAIVMATSSRPPAMALLSTGDVLVEGDRMMVGIDATSSAVHRLQGGFSLLVPMDTMALRVEVVDAVARVSGSLAVVTGSIAVTRPTAEPPWRLVMTFAPDPGEGFPTEPYLDYWRSVRAWLAGDNPQPPQLPRA